LEFADADEIPSWAYEYVLIAKENGIIHGYDDNTFKPHNKCNRQEMVTMLVNAFGLGESDKILPLMTRVKFTTMQEDLLPEQMNLDLYKVILIILSDRLIILPLQKPQLLL